MFKFLKRTAKNIGDSFSLIVLSCVFTIAFIAAGLAASIITLVDYSEESLAGSVKRALVTA